VNLDPRVAASHALRFRYLWGGVIVHQQDAVAGRDRHGQVLEEGHDLFVATPVLPLHGDLAGGDLQRGEHRCGGVPTSSRVCGSAYALAGSSASSQHNTIAFFGGNRDKPMMLTTLAQIWVSRT
jgi:hypothetical protein